MSNDHLWGGAIGGTASNPGKIILGRSVWKALPCERCGEGFTEAEWNERETTAIRHWHKVCPVVEVDP